MNCSQAAIYHESIWAPAGTTPRVKDEEATALLEEMKANIKQSIGVSKEHIHLYSVPWVSRSVEVKQHPVLGPFLQRLEASPGQKELIKREMMMSGLDSSFLDRPASQLHVLDKRNTEEPPEWSHYISCRI